MLRLAYDVVFSPSGRTTNPLLILHGLFGSKRNWLSLSKALARELDRPVYSLDLRNHGDSPHAHPMTYPAMADDILHFCQHHELSHISLLGHSMGGKVASTLALYPNIPPSLLTHLIIADMAPSRGSLSHEFRQYVHGMKKVEEALVESRKEAEVMLAQYESDPVIRAFLLTNLDTRTKPLKFRVPLDLISDAIPELGDFPYDPPAREQQQPQDQERRMWDGKTLFIKGGKSNYINAKNIPTAQRFFPHMKLETLDAGHWVHAEKPNEFRKLVVDFIKA